MQRGLRAREYNAEESRRWTNKKRFQGVGYCSLRSKQEVEYFPVDRSILIPKVGGSRGSILDISTL